MRITAITWTPYEYTLRHPIGDVNLSEGVRHGSDLAVEVQTDAGVTGVTISYGGAGAAIDSLAPLLIGEDPRAVRSLWQRMVSAAFKAGNAGPMKLAISALDCALWDLRAKANGVPLWKELGGREGRVPAYASGLDFALSDEELVKYYESMAAQGIYAGKLKVGRHRQDDARRLALMAEALATSGREPVLMIDANEYWSPKQAVQRVHELERDFDLAWVEEPVRRHDYAGLRQVSAGIRAPVATGENLNQAFEFVPLLEHGAVDVVQIGMLHSGITGALQVAELAAAHERPVTMSNCPGRIMAHLAAVLPHHTSMEVLDVGRDAVLQTQPPIVDGMIQLGDEPGSGIVFDQEKLRAHAPGSRPAEPTLGNSYGRDPGAGLVG